MTRILETDDQGALVIPRELLMEPAPHSRYVVERQGYSLKLDLESRSSQRTTSHQDWILRWKAIGERLDQSSITEKSAVDILTEMRR